MFSSYGSVLDHSLLGKDLVVSFGSKLELSFVSKKTVLLLLNVGKLSVAESEYARIVKKRIGQTLKSFKELRLVLNALSVSPTVSVFGHYPADSAVLADEYGQICFGDLALGVRSVKLIVYDSLSNMSVIFLKLYGILLIIVNVVNVGALGGIRSARGDNGTGLVKRLCYIVYGIKENIALLSAELVPGLVGRTPTDNRGVREVTLDLLKPFGKEIVDSLVYRVIKTPVTGFGPDHITESVCVIEEAGLEYLLMESCAIKTALHRSLYIKYKMLVVRSGDDSVGIEALIENEASEYGLSVDLKTLFLGESDLTESEITVKNVGLSVLGKLEYEIVKSAASALPKMLFAELYLNGGGK